jgi:hypothetical protein
MGRAVNLDTRPTFDQMYLAERIELLHDTNEITIAGIQRLNTRYGVAIVTQAMRTVRGFPPATKIEHPYPYVENIARKLAEQWAEEHP